MMAVDRIDGRRRGKRKEGEEPCMSKHQLGTPARPNSGANGDRENILPVQLTTSRIVVCHTRLMLNLLNVGTYKNKVY